MKTTIKTTITATAISTLTLMSLFGHASALTKSDALLPTNAVVQEAAYTKLPNSPIHAAKTTFNSKATIGIARLDKGRLIAAPMGEVQDWEFLNKRTAQNFDIINPAALISNIPEVPMGGRDSDNKLDEIRMTASDLRMDYVLVYGMGADAQWGSFAGKSLMETGFITGTYAPSRRGGAKALLVDTYSGKVYGTLTSDEIEFGIGDLTDKVQALVSKLGKTDEQTQA